MPGIDLQALRSCQGRVVFTDPADEGFPVSILREWDGPRLRSRLRSDGDRPVRIREIVLAGLPHDLPGDTRLYGEGFTHLSLTGGTIAQPIDLGRYTDRDHYRLPKPEGATTVYHCLLLSPPGRDHVLLAFATAFRFVGRIDLRPGSIEVVLEAEDLALDPGEIWYLEDLVLLAGPDPNALLGDLAGRLAKNHCYWFPMFPSPPAGWCSWYHYGPRVTGGDVRANLDFISRELPELRYIQIDDGYQAAMGDWLDTGKAFGGGVREVIGEIRDRGFEPAIWVAPFVAQEDSRVFAEHPDWFVMDDDGAPLRSDRVTFGGWRNSPWYALDGTHPGAQGHLQRLFHTMRREWGCSYFKLDANYWGALRGRHFEPKATRIEAYRKGMRAVHRGSGDAFLLGCNHPLWPSIGLVHGSRSSNDIGRSRESITETARQNLMRTWQNDRFWWNDADCVVLTGDLPENEFRFHASVIYASGGLVLSGDDLNAIPRRRLDMLGKLLPPTGKAAAFTDDSLTVGTIDLDGVRMICLFNWTDSPQTLEVPLTARSHITDFWTGEDLGLHECPFRLPVEPRSARLLECRPAS